MAVVRPSKKWALTEIESRPDTDRVGKALRFARLAGASIMAASLALPWTTCTARGGVTESGYGSGAVAGIPLVVFLLWPLAIAIWQLFSPPAVNRLVSALDLVITLLSGYIQWVMIGVTVAFGFGTVQLAVGARVFAAGWGLYVAAALLQLWYLFRRRSSVPTPTARAVL
jgi:hypothetical protein